MQPGSSGVSRYRHWYDIAMNDSLPLCSAYALYDGFPYTNLSTCLVPPAYYAKRKGMTALEQWGTTKQLMLD